MWRSVFTTINGALAERAEQICAAVSAGSALYVVIAVAVLAQGAASQTPASAPRAQLVIVVDGLRPDYVTPALMPRLTRLGQRGTVFNAHHSVFPTVTRVNASSMATGVYPEAHGLLGNTVYVPAVNATKGLDTGSRENLEAIARANGPLLTAPSLGEILKAAGKSLFVAGAGTSGAAFLLNHTASAGPVVHQEFTRPPSFAAHVLDTLGPVPPSAMPNAALNTRAVDAYLRLGLDEMHADLAFIWISDPDHTAHNKGIGSETTNDALRLVDAQIGRIEDTLRAKGLLERTNIVVVSDHGFTTHTGALKLASLVSPFARALPDGSPDIVVSEGAINFRVRAEAARVAAIVAMLQKQPEVGAIFTRAKPGGGAEGVARGTLSFGVARWSHPRSGEILVSSNWTVEPNEAGYLGKTADNGVAGHGTTSPYDVHNTLIAAGPDFRERASSSVPTGNVDLAPTLLRLLGVAIPPSMTGRVIEEGLRSGPPIASVTVERVTQTVKTADGRYALTAHLSKAAGKTYLDFTDVKRP
jgi:predicted AlkP superfamily pyrophosphatase or phosphodiesterase